MSETNIDEVIKELDLLVKKTFKLFTEAGYTINITSSITCQASDYQRVPVGPLDNEGLEKHRAFLSPDSVTCDIKIRKDLKGSD